MKAIAELQAAAQKKDCAALVGPARIIVADTKIPEEIRAQVYGGLVGCEGDLKQADAAYKDALAATALSSSTDAAWMLRLSLEIDAKKWQAGVATVEQMAEKRPMALANLDVEWLGYIHRSLDQPKDEAPDMRLLKILTSAYVPLNPFSEPTGSGWPMPASWSNRARQRRRGRS